MWRSPRHLDRAAASAAKCVVIAPGLALAGKDSVARRESEAGICARCGMAFASRSHRDGHSPDRGDRSHSATCGRRCRRSVRGDRRRSEDREQAREIGAFCFIGRGARLGEGCRLYPRVTLYAGAQLANRVIVHSGAVIGSDGFGYVADGGKRLEISTGWRSRNRRMTWRSARTRRSIAGRWSARKSALARNWTILCISRTTSSIGENTVIAAQTGISGSAVIGSDVAFGGQAGLGDHCEIEDGAVIGGAGWNSPGKIVRSGQIVWGTPARPINLRSNLHGSAACRNWRNASKASKSAMQTKGRMAVRNLKPKRLSTRL